ncbi:MAG TPA: DUF5388 domain-containing protein [Ligilactobacillus salivarius]|jgi:hypothetical protein|uniref:DUF5388 domain-containing protein n=1 Tax=Ligilactobacillus salivarius TaxID=1624 RepID=A0A921LJR5_9LACO|nr:DUF5388 domain-containing protein [Ligilactobacillus salivarius]
MSNLLNSNRDLKDLQPKSTFSSDDLKQEKQKDNGKEAHKITKKHAEQSVNMKVSKSARDLLLTMVTLGYAKSQKDAVDILAELYKEHLSPAERQLVDQQLNILRNKATGRMLG